MTDDRPTRQDLEDMIHEIEEILYVLHERDDQREMIDSLKLQIARLKARLMNW